MDSDGYKANFSRLYDIAERVCKGNMDRLQKKLEHIETLLLKKYPDLIEVEFADTEQKWKSLLAEHGQILVATHKETGELMYVIFDLRIG